tara:strand:+ start:105 stop:698 length:594 start_codon:yes stop_codon:yes gene_type:complete
MRVLVACEFSGIVREAFAQRGHDAYSCDFLPSEIPSDKHYQGDVFDLIDTEEYDLMIAHPPCTHLSVSGALHFHKKKIRQRRALAFVQDLLDAPILRIALENPVSVISTKIRKPDQYIQPWMFGHGETKKTGLWLKNLPPLYPTNIMVNRRNNLTPSGQNKLTPSPTRWMDRSRTYTGLAAAMADQWGNLCFGGKTY